MSDKEVWRCPEAKTPEGSISYVYKGKGLTESCPPDTILAYDADGNHPDGRNVLFADGHVAWLTEATFQRALKGEKVSAASESEPPPEPQAVSKYNPTVDRCVGEQMAIETAKLLAGQGDIVVLSMAAGKFKSVVAEAQMEGFKNGLKQHVGIKIAAVVGPQEKEMMEFFEGVSEKCFMKAVKDNPNAKAIVSFLGLPIFAKDGQAVDVSKLPKVIALNLSVIGKWQELVRSGIVNVVILPRYDVRWDQLLTTGECPALFTSRYLVVTKDNFAEMAEKLKQFYPMP